jgi:hypothetical protein
MAEYAILSMGVPNGRNVAAALLTLLSISTEDWVGIMHQVPPYDIHSPQIFLFKLIFSHH